MKRTWHRLMAWLWCSRHMHGREDKHGRCCDCERRVER
jgi:hypothetical protein